MSFNPTSQIFSFWHCYWSAASRFMNQYFLLIACLQLWSLITPVNPASTWGPLIFIFAVSASKEAWDDYNRYLSDKKANEKEVWVVRHGVKKHVCHIFLSFFSESVLYLFVVFCLSPIIKLASLLGHSRTSWIFSSSFGS